NDDVFDPETMVTRPGALIPVKSHDTLRPITYLQNYAAAYNEIADLKAELQEATGALKYSTGSDNAAHQPTATEVSALVAGGSQKLSSFLAHLEHSSLVPFLRIVFECARQFVSEPECLRMIGPDGVVEYREILPQLLKLSDCHFRIDGSRGTLQR